MLSISVLIGTLFAMPVIAGQFGVLGTALYYIDKVCLHLIICVALTALSKQYKTRDFKKVCICITMVVSYLSLFNFLGAMMLDNEVEVKTYLWITDG